MSKNTITVAFDSFDLPVTLSKEGIDIANKHEEGGKLILEPLAAYAGLGRLFRTIVGVKYTITYHDIEMDNSTALDKLRIAACKSGELLESNVIKSPYINKDGTYSIDFIAATNEGFCKIYMEGHTYDHQIKVGAMSITVTDALQDFEQITSSNKDLIVHNLQANLDVLTEQQVCMDLLTTSITDYNTNAAKISSIWNFAETLKAITLVNTQLNLDYKNLNLSF